MGKLERKYGKYAIHNLSLMLIICYAFGYIIQLVNGGFSRYLTLNPYEIIHHFQIWRLVTWIIIPPPEKNLFFVLISLYFYYSIGTSLEHTWGTFRYNVYIFSGMLFTIAGSFVMMAFTYIIGNGENAIPAVMMPVYFEAASYYFSTYYVNMSIFLAFAATFPDVQVLLMFIIPIKVKILGIVYAVLLGAEFFMNGFVAKCAIAASLLNFIVFFFTSRNRVRLSPKQIKRRQEFRHEIKKASGITKHKCAICGRTNEDDENLEFRFCSKCDGNYEYCSEHLFTHEHVKK